MTADFTIDTDTIQGRQLDALVRSTNRRAQLRLTVDIRKSSGERYHQTFRVKGWDGRDGHRMLTFDLGDGDWANDVRATKALHVDTATGLATPARGMSDPPILYAARAALRWATTGEGPSPTNGTVEISSASICGACGLELTHPVSLELGVGPECAARLGLGHHYESQTLTGRARRGVRVLRDREAEQAIGLVGSTSTDACENDLGRMPAQVGEVLPAGLLSTAADELAA